MRETQVQSEVQAIFQAMDEFDDADVVISDWSILDRESVGAPYLNIENAVNIDSREDTAAEQCTYDLPVTVFERFTTWTETHNRLRITREAVINEMTGVRRSANGLEGFTINRIRTDGPILEVMDKGLSREEAAVADPAFLAQRLLLACEEF